MLRKLIAFAPFVLVGAAHAAPSIGLYTITAKTADALYDNRTPQTRRVLMTICANAGDVVVGPMFANSQTVAVPQYKLTAKQCISATYDLPAGQAVGVATSAPLANGTYSVDPIG